VWLRSLRLHKYNDQLAHLEFLVLLCVLATLGTVTLLCSG